MLCQLSSLIFPLINEKERPTFLAKNLTAHEILIYNIVQTSLFISKTSLIDGLIDGSKFILLANDSFGLIHNPCRCEWTCAVLYTYNKAFRQMNCSLGSMHSLWNVFMKTVLITFLYPAHFAGRKELLLWRKMWSKIGLCTSLIHFT